MPRFMLVANWIALLVFSWGLVRSDVWRTIIQVALGPVSYTHLTLPTILRV